MTSIPRVIFSVTKKRKERDFRKRACFNTQQESVGMFLCQKSPCLFFPLAASLISSIKQEWDPRDDSRSMLFPTPITGLKSQQGDSWRSFSQFWGGKYTHIIMNPLCGFSLECHGYTPHPGQVVWQFWESKKSPQLTGERTNEQQAWPLSLINEL